VNQYKGLPLNQTQYVLVTYRIQAFSKMIQRSDVNISRRWIST